MRFILSFALILVIFADTSAAAEVIHVDVTGIAFAQKKVTAHVGDTIEWNNKDFVAHSATAKAGDSWDIQLPAHGKGGVILKKAGHISYYCKYHPAMTGEIDVK